MNRLAINGGKPIREAPFPAHNPIGPEEITAVSEVLRSGVLSKYLAKWSSDFFGGPKVKEFERMWSDAHEVKHTLSVNSATSGLYAAVGAAGVGPGDEVIVSPITMSASATAILIYNAIPVFADVQDDIFNLDPESVRTKITPRTKALMVTHIFGHPADMDPIMEIAHEHNLKVIEDCAQAPMTRYKGKYVGTIGDIGVFSLNYHKHIHTGEGGMVCTNDDDLKERLALIRNHGEIAATARNLEDIVNLIGFNYRLTELQAAIGIEQLKKLPALMQQRFENAMYLYERIGRIPGLKRAVIYDNCDHAFYVQPFKYDENEIRLPRAKFIEAVRGELAVTELREAQGPLVFEGYVKPLYLQALYQRMVAYGNKGCPFACPFYDGVTDYSKGVCPVAERLYEKELIFHEIFLPPMTTDDLDDVAKAFEKVYDNRKELM